MPIRRIHRFRLLAGLIALPIMLPAQAFLSPKGEGTVSVLYQYSIDRLHAFSDGRTKDAGHMYWDTVVLDTDYSLTDRFAVGVSLPFLDGKYVGSSPHQVVRGDPSTAVKLDDGAYHGTVTDFRLSARYSMRRGLFKVVPYFQATIPAHPYPVFLHALYGADSREYRGGLSVGRSLDPILRKAYFQARYGFGVSQNFANITPKVSYGELQLGYFVTRRFSMQASVVGTYAHNGLPWDYNRFPNDFTQDQWLNHIRVSRGRLLDAGGGIGYSFNRSTSLVLALSHSFWGENTHLRYLVATVGFVKAFSAPWSGERASAIAAIPEAAKATPCTCAKSK